MTLMTFGIIAVGLIIVALAFVVPALKRKSAKVSDSDHNSLNIAIYKERLAELAEENLTPEQQAQAQQELDKTLAQELDSGAKPTNQVRARWASVAVAIAIPALAIGLYWKQGAWHLLMPPPVIAAQPNHQPGGKPSDFDEMVDNLAVRLEKDPSDEQGWRMLARSYMHMERYAKAAQAFDKLVALVGKQEPELLTDYAQALVLSNNGMFSEKATTLLKSALALAPDSQQALWLSGLAAFQKKAYQAAIDYWQRLIQQTPPPPPNVKTMLEGHIADARRQMGQGEEPIAPVTPEKTVTLTDNDSTPSESVEAAKVVQIEVHVTLAEALQEQVKPGDTLFVYARATQGSPMPLAIVKKSASELPITVVLDDSMAMTPSMKLSSFKEVMILARVSSSGSAMLQSGDLQGKVSPVILGKQDKIVIMIDQIAP
jgi:cytochrome c-type biogenesis protein CcmH